MVRVHLKRLEGLVSRGNIQYNILRRAAKEVRVVTSTSESSYKAIVLVEASAQGERAMRVCVKSQEKSNGGRAS